jgi:hypothetical protein
MSIGLIISRFLYRDQKITEGVKLLNTRENSWKAWQALQAFILHEAHFRQINSQRHTILLIAAFRGVNWPVLHLPGIQTLPAGNRAKPSTHRTGDKLLDTPPVPGHP